MLRVYQSDSYSLKESNKELNAEYFVSKGNEIDMLAYCRTNLFDYTYSSANPTRKTKINSFWKMFRYIVSWRGK